MQKFQISNSKSQISSNDQNTNDPSKRIQLYNLEERTYKFAQQVTLFSKKLPRSISNVEYIKQVIKSSGSVGANYIEANEALSKKDFVMRIKICRKEAKESAYWIALIIGSNTVDFKQEGILLKEEAVELKKIFSSIIRKCY